RGDLRDDPVAFVRQVADQFATLSADHVIVDCGSGRWPATVATFAEATVGILVTTPEPAALESLYLFTETYLRWILLRAVTGESMWTIQERLQKAGLDPQRLSFRDFMTRLRSIDSGARDAIAALVRRTRLELLLNQGRGEAEEEAAACLASGFRKLFGVPLATAGIIDHDLSILQAVQKRRPLSQQYPNAASTKEISRAAARLLSVGVGPLRAADEEWEDLEALDHYRVLEVVPKASAKEVQSAYQLVKKTYDPETTCLTTLTDAPGPPPIPRRKTRRRAGPSSRGPLPAPAARPPTPARSSGRPRNPRIRSRPSPPLPLPIDRRPRAGPICAKNGSVSTWRSRPSP